MGRKTLPESGRAHYGPERRLVRKAEKAASKYERLDRKYQKNEARISKIRNNHKKMARTAKLQEKRERLELKKAKLNKRVTRAQQTFMRGEEPGFFDRRAVKKNAELDREISKIVKKENPMKAKLSKLEYKRETMDKKLSKYYKTYTKSLSKLTTEDGRNYVMSLQSENGRLRVPEIDRSMDEYDD